MLTLRDQAVSVRSRPLLLGSSLRLLILLASASLVSSKSKAMLE